MPISGIYEELREIALHEFAEIVVHAEIQRLPTGDPRKLRLSIVDNSFVDIFVSITGRYSYHWGRASTAGSAIYRHDNAPHKAWRYIATFPKHFHNGSEENVTESTISSRPAEAIRSFCRFVLKKLQSEAQGRET